MLRIMTENQEIRRLIYRKSKNLMMKKTLKKISKMIILIYKKHQIMILSHKKYQIIQIEIYSEKKGLLLV